MKRYDTYGGSLAEYEDGEYVRYEDVAELERQLAEVTKERDQLRAMLNLADALRNKERNVADRFGKDNPASMAPFGYFKGEK